MSTFKYAEQIVCVLQPSASRGGLFISNVQAAQNLSTLRKHEIYAVVTVARGYRLVHPQHSLPRYLYLPAQDHEHFHISDYFESSNSFIRENIKVTNVLVHCAAGISRSAALIIAYLMRCQKMGFMEGLVLLKSRRPKVQPNRGFIRQLQEYQTKLQRARSPERAGTYRSSPEKYRPDSISYASRTVDPMMTQSPTVYSSILKPRPATQTNWFTPNTRYLSGSKVSLLRQQRTYSASRLQQNLPPNTSNIITTKQKPGNMNHNGYSSCRPQTPQIREITEQKYDSMRHELDQLKENIKELKDKFSKMKTETLNEFGMSPFSKKAQQQKYGHWRG